MRRALSRVSALVAFAAAVLADPAGATTADDLCSPSADPCRVSSNVAIDPGSDIDVGTRELQITNRGTLDLSSGAMTLRARTFTLQSGGSVLGRSTADEPGGRIIAMAETMSIAGMIDSSGGPGGTVQLTATGDLVLSGIIDVRSRSGDAGGGSVDLQGNGVTLAPGSRIIASGGADDFGGEVTLHAAAALLVGGDITASGGDGGGIDLSAATTLTVSQNVVLNTDATAAGGSGGNIDCSGGAGVTINGELSAVGRNGSDDTGGGDGGSITIDGTSIDVPITSSRLTVQAGNPDGVGGDVDLTSTVGAISIRGQLVARGAGTDGTGGMVTIDVTGDAMLSGTIDGSGGSDGGGSIDVTSLRNVTIVTTASFTVAGNGTGNGGDIDVSGGALVTVTGTLSADGGNSTGGRGGSVEVSACTVRLDAGGRLTSLRSAGTNTLIGRDLTVVAGTMRADPGSGRNRILYAGSQYEPSILPGAEFDPPLTAVIDNSVAPCNPVATRTPTVTPIRSTPTRTQATPTSTPTVGAIRCVGDCDGSGTVIVSELIVGVNIALSQQPITNCPAFDVNGDSRVTINELILAVGNALDHCPA